MVSALASVDDSVSVQQGENLSKMCLTKMALQKSIVKNADKMVIINFPNDFLSKVLR